MRRRGAIPLADAAALAPLARRTALIAAALAAAALIAVVAALIVARRPQEAGRGFVPTSGETVVVLDVSASLSADTFSREGAALERLRARRGASASSCSRTPPTSRCRWARRPGSSCRLRG